MEPGIPEPARPNAPPLVSAEGYARFEQRARRRRIDNRLAAARSAISESRVDEAREALDELRELDPLHPDLEALAAAFEGLNKGGSLHRFGRSLAAGAVFSALVLGATILENTATTLRLYPRAITVGTVGLVEGTTPPREAFEFPDPDAADALEPLADSPPREVRDTYLAAVVEVPPAPVSAPPFVPAIPDSAAGTGPARELTPMAEVSRAVATPNEPPPVNPSSSSAGNLPSVAAPEVRDAPAVPAPAVAAAATAVPSVIAPAAHPVPVPEDDERLVRDVLQRYRAAYDDLNAASAQAVWPTLDKPALARAFEGLSSQRLLFDACSVEVHGVLASANCRGSARYVPKVGARETRVEPRNWTFTLRKSAGAWAIDAARTER